MLVTRRAPAVMPRSFTQRHHHLTRHGARARIRVPPSSAPCTRRGSPSPGTRPPTCPSPRDGCLGNAVAGEARRHVPPSSTASAATPWTGLAWHRRGVNSYALIGPATEQAPGAIIGSGLRSRGWPKPCKRAMSTAPRRMRRVVAACKSYVPHHYRPLPGPGTCPCHPLHHILTPTRRPAECGRTEPWSQEGTRSALSNKNHSSSIKLYSKM